VNNLALLPIQKSFRPLFAKISVNCNFGEVINYEPFLFSPQPVPNVHIQSLSIRLLDEYGGPIQFNNGFWSLTLSIQWVMDIGSAGLEDVTMGRTFHPA
jgi:hypothetical protein